MTRVLAGFTLLTGFALAQLPGGPGPINIPPPSLGTRPQQTVAFLGDSWGAGEGAPNPTGKVWDETDCHRSKQKGRFAAATALQNAAGASFVTLSSPPRLNFDFIDVSCSGATINAGILGRYEGVFRMTPNGPGRKEHANGFASQIDQVADWLSGRQLDMLVISIGGNDAGFASVVSSCMSPIVTSCSSDQPTLDAMANGAPVWVNGRQVNNRLIGFNHLEQAFQNMDAQIRQRLNPRHIVLVDYPNPLRFASLCHGYDDGVAIFSLDTNSPTSQFSEGWLGIGAATKNVTADEAAFMETSLLNPLNTRRNLFAHNLGWDSIDFGSFAINHGYCADDAWFNTPKDSWNLQSDYNGTAHPNAKGYQVFEKFILRYMTHTLNINLTTGTRLDDERFYITYPQPPSTSHNPTAQVANKPPIEVNQNTWQQSTPEQQEYIMDNASLNLEGLMFPTPDHTVQLALQVSTKPFDFHPTAADMTTLTVPLHPAPEGTYTASFPLRPYDAHTDLYIRWQVKYTPFYDASDARYTYTSQQHFVVKGVSPAEKESH